MSAKKYILIVGAIVIVGVGILWSVGKGQAALQGSQSQRNASPQDVPKVQTTTVVSKDLQGEQRLPGEMKAYEEVAIYPKIESFVEWIGVDRGSIVKRGQPLIRMTAPEIASRQAEASERAGAAVSQRHRAEARVQSSKAQLAEAEAKLAADEATYENLKAAAATPGVVAGNDVTIAQKTVEADRAGVKMYQENQRAAQSEVDAMAKDERAAANVAQSAKEITSYLHINAPFDGVITERNVHPGSFAGPAAGAGVLPMLRIQQVSTLRVVVFVPEAAVSGASIGEPVSFSVPAFPGEKFDAKVARIAHALDPKTRTMPVELDVANKSMNLAPGMYCEVQWPARRPSPSLFVPASAVAVTTERIFVIRVKDNKAEWVDIKQGAAMGDLVEVFGDLTAGDTIAVRGTDEIRNGSAVNAQPVTAAK